MVKLLPKPSSTIHLADDGYSTHKSKSVRQKSLKKSSRKYGSLTVMKRLNLIRNLSRHNSKQKNIMSQDVEFLKKQYAKEKKKKRKSK